MAAVSVVPSILDYVGDDVIRSELLPRAKLVHSANSGDVKIVLSLLACIAKVLYAVSTSQCVSSESSLSMLFYSHFCQILDKLGRGVIIDEVLPLLIDIKLNDVNILITVLGKTKVIKMGFTVKGLFFSSEIYRVMLSDKKYGLTVSILATRVMPVLLPQLVNPQLDLEVYLMVQTTTQEMLDHIDKHQRNKLKGDLADLPKQPECLKLRTERGLETMAIPNLVIRRPSVVQVSIALYIINTERVKRDRFS